MKKYYLSKNYKESVSAGYKAKTDIEKIVEDLGYRPAGLPQTNHQNQIAGFLLTLMNVLKMVFTISSGDILLVQYPFKKYYAFICRTVRQRKGKTITVIHDLGSFRRKKLRVEEEIKRLSLTDVLIVHNHQMKKWLLEQGYTKPIICLEIFDYLSASDAERPHHSPVQPYKVIYAGALAFKKNRFLYLLDNRIHTWRFVLYGSGLEEERIMDKAHFSYNGFIPSEQLIRQADGDFGLVWDGDSTATCSGNFGEYLKLNNPHKTSLYIRCHLPVIIWKEAALATFIEENKIGICVESLEELNDILPCITKEEYDKMVSNIQDISSKLASGYYITQALKEAEKHLL